MYEEQVPIAKKTAWTMSTPTYGSETSTLSSIWVQPGCLISTNLWSYWQSWRWARSSGLSFPAVILAGQFIYLEMDEQALALMLAYCAIRLCGNLTRGQEVDREIYHLLFRWTIYISCHRVHHRGALCMVLAILFFVKHKLNLCNRNDARSLVWKEILKYDSV